MKRRSLPWLAGLVLAFMLILVCGRQVVAQPGNSLGAPSSDQSIAPTGQSAHFILSWDVIASGGGVLSSPNYKLHHTIDQPSTGNINGTSYATHAGFWQWFYRKVFLPLILR